jgi:hypothetical protein
MWVSLKGAKALSDALRTTRRTELFTIAVCVQLVFVMISVVVATRFPAAATPLLFFYLPLIYLVSEIIRFRSQGISEDISGIVYPLLFGVACGVILYAYIFALIVSWSSQRQRRPAKS